MTVRQLENGRYEVRWRLAGRGSRRLSRTVDTEAEALDLLGSVVGKGRSVPDDEAFCHWLAGFIDGEGCFQIRPRGVAFSMCLRDDDRAILEEIQQRLGIGRLYRLCANGTSKPQASWQVTSKAGVSALVQFLDRYPLRAKKRHDYAIWREAVALHAGTDRNHTRWDELAALRARLVAVRAYPEA